MVTARAHTTSYPCRLWAVGVDMGPWLVKNAIQAASGDWLVGRVGHTDTPREASMDDDGARELRAGGRETAAATMPPPPPRPIHHHLLTAADPFV